MDTYIRWNAVNWVTIVLMASIGFAVYGFAGQAILTALGKVPGQ